MIGIPQFGRDKNVLPGNAAPSYGSADTFLVTIHGRGIDVPVPRFQRGKHRRFTARTRANLPHAQTELRHEATIVEFYFCLDRKRHASTPNELPVSSNVKAK